MDLTAIDRSATSKASAVHRASTAAKLAAFALVLASVVVSWDLLVLAALALALAAVAVASRLPLRLAFSLAAYPALFAVVFAFASASSAMDGATIVLKAVVAALAAVVLTLTTPYPQVFGALQRVVPPLVGDALLMTYRTFFLLAERMGDVARVIRLRSSGEGGVLLRVRMASSAMGNVVLYAFDLAQRDYDIMRVRGYEDRLAVTLYRSRRPGSDAALVASGALGLAIALAWRLGWRALNPYSWIPVAVAAGLLGIGLVLRNRR